MADAPTPPMLPPLEGWVRIGDATDRPFELGPVNIVVRTVVHEDAAIRERVSTTADSLWRFLFASRLEIRPHTPPSKSLTKPVGKCASAGFRSRLEAHGFSDVRHVESRALRMRVGGGSDDQCDAGRDDDTRGGDTTGSEADVIRYAATAELAGVELAADTYLAVAPIDGGFLLTGDAHPREVRGDDGETAAALRGAIEPERFREELFRAIRGVG